MKILESGPITAVLVLCVTVLACSGSSTPAADATDTARDAGSTIDGPIPDVAIDGPAPDVAIDGPAPDVAIDGPIPDSVSPTCQLGPGALSQGYHTRNITHEIERLYTVYLPVGYQPQGAMPVVLALHGGFGTADGMKDYVQLNPTADKHGFIVVYPEGYKKAWNAGHCCGAPKNQDLDDVGFIRKVLEDLATVACLDPQRVYATGLSNGSMMSHRLACELSDRIAAIAGVAGQVSASYLASCNPPRKISIMHMHGTDDRCAPVAGGESAGGCLAGLQVCDASDPPVTDPKNPPPGISCIGQSPPMPSLVNIHPPLTDTIDHWLAHNACDASAKQTQVIGAVNIFTYPCADGTELKHYQIVDGGHSWPGGPDSACCEPNRLANTDIDANEEIWKFFSAHTLAAP